MLSLLSGLGFENGGLATAHALDKGLTALDEPRKWLHGERVAAGVADLFDARVDGVDAERPGLPDKPDPAIFVRAAERVGAAPERAAVVEDALRDRLRGRGLAVFLDFDGVLAPIVENYDEAKLDDAMREALARLAERAPTAVMSGRDPDDVRTRVGLDALFYAGGHGFDIAGPKGWRAQLEKGASSCRNSMRRGASCARRLSRSRARSSARASRSPSIIARRLRTRRGASRIWSTRSCRGGSTCRSRTARRCSRFSRGRTGTRAAPGVGCSIGSISTGRGSSRSMSATM